MEIKLLPKSVRDSLRTGINIQSMSHCVSQLILNSLDAKSMSIAVRINLVTHKIQIIDNGTGISKQNLKLIGLRYATSKYFAIKDKKPNQNCFGSRGEALASIIKLSKVVKITSRQADKTYCKIFESGKYVSIDSVKQRPSQGTTIIIENFMYNMPVRKNHMKHNNCLDDIKYEIECISLIHPNTSFSLKNDSSGEIIFHSYRTKFIYQTASFLYGKEFAKELRKVYLKDTGLTVSGLISIKAHPHNKIQFVYVNNRHVNKTKIHSLINSLISKSYIVKPKNNISSPPVAKQKYGAFIINIKCSHSEIDILDSINVVVEFKNWEKVSLCVEKAIHKFFDKENLIDPPNTNENVNKGSPISEKIEPIRTSQVAGVIRSFPAKRKRKESENVTLAKKIRKTNTNLDLATSPIKLTNQTKKENIIIKEPEIILDSCAENGKNIIMDMFLKSTAVFRNNDDVEDMSSFESMNDGTEKSCYIIATSQNKRRIITNTSTSTTFTISHEIQQDSIKINQVNTFNDFKKPFLPNKLKAVEKIRHKSPKKIILEPKQQIKINKVNNIDELNITFLPHSLKAIEAIKHQCSKSPKKNILKPEHNCVQTIATKNNKLTDMLNMKNNIFSPEINQINNICARPRRSYKCIVRKTKTVKERINYMRSSDFLRPAMNFTSRLINNQDKRIERKAKGTIHVNSLLKTWFHVKKNPTNDNYMPIKMINNNSGNKDRFRKMICNIPAKSNALSSLDNINYKDKKININSCISRGEYIGNLSADLKSIKYLNDIKNKSVFLNPLLYKPLDISNKIFFFDFKKIHSNCLDLNNQKDIKKTSLVKFNYNSPTLYHKHPVTADKSYRLRPLQYLNKSDHNTEENFDKLKLVKCCAQKKSILQNDANQIEKARGNIRYGLENISFVPDVIERFKNNEHRQNISDNKIRSPTTDDIYCNNYSPNINENINKGLPTSKKLEPINTSQVIQSFPAKRKQNEKENVSFANISDTEIRCPATDEMYYNSAVIPRTPQITFVPFKTNPQLNRTTRNLSQISVPKPIQLNYSPTNTFDSHAYTRAHIINRKLDLKPPNLINNTSENSPASIQNDCVNENIDFNKSITFSFEQPNINNDQVSFINEDWKLNDSHREPNRKMERSSKDLENFGNSQHTNLETPVIVISDDSNLSIPQNCTETNIRNFDYSQVQQEINSRKPNLIFEASEECHVPSASVLCLSLQDNEILNTSAKKSSLKNSQRASTIVAENNNDNCEEEIELIRKTTESENIFFSKFKNGFTNNLTNQLENNSSVTKEKSLNDKCSKISTETQKNNLESDNEIKSKFDNDAEWLHHKNEFNSYYLNSRTGMSSFQNPEKSGSYSMTKRYPFMPKGMSPILFPSSTITSKELSPISKSTFHQIIANCENDELRTIKWKQYLKDKDENKFFTDLYLDKSKFETAIKSNKLNSISKKIIGGFENFAFSKEQFNKISVINQWDHKFIVAQMEIDEKKNMLVLFDQHAVHERVLLEKLLREYQNEHENFKSISCKVPLTITVSDYENRMLHNYKTNFENWGFSYDSVEKGKVRFTKIPLCWQSKDDSNVKEASGISTLILTLIQEESNWIRNVGRINIALPLVIQNVVKSEACRGAIKFGDELNREQCSRHIKELFLCDLPFQCAHGRPTLIPIFDLDYNLNHSGKEQKINFKSLLSNKKKDVGALY